MAEESRISESLSRRIADALAEDIGAADWTTRWCVPEDLDVEAEIVAKAPGVVAGLDAAAEVFRQLGPVRIDAAVEDGDRVVDGTVVARLTGRAGAILTGERTALNFLMWLSGVATLTRRFADAVQGTDARITDTRKTTPLWRDLERAATRAGGAVNHRDRLDAMVLVKDNHAACAGGLGNALDRVRRSNAGALKVEAEVRDLDELPAALDAGVDRIMLDNMSVAEVREAVRRIRESPEPPEIEVSGGVTLDTVRALAECGADFISVGALTHSAPALDLSLRIRGLLR